MSKPGRTGTVIVYLNGMAVMGDEVWSIRQMSLNEVESVIIERIKESIPVKKK